VADNVHYGPRLAKRGADVAGSLRLAGLDPSFAPRRADALSVGGQQRVMLARALALQPSVLLLDEPTSALDEVTKAAIEATLRDLRGRLGLSFVLVTHDLHQAARRADRVLVLEPGARTRLLAVSWPGAAAPRANPCMRRYMPFLLKRTRPCVARATPRPQRREAT
jgi:ABC-type glutathione transport system ATPase component